MSCRSVRLAQRRHLRQTIFLLPICPSGFTAKLVPHLLDKNLAREPNVKNVWQHTETMVSRIQLIALFATPVPSLFFVNPSHQKTEKSEDVLNRSGRFWLRNYQKNSPTKMPKEISSFQPLMSGHKSSAYTIAETELESFFFKSLPQWAHPSWTRTKIQYHCSWFVRALHYE